MLYTERIRTHREAKGISPDDMARMMDMSHTTYRKLEAGQRVLTVGNLERLAQLLDTTPAELVPSMGTGKYNVQLDNNTFHQQANVSNELTINGSAAEAERQLWYELDKSRLSIIAAQEQTILAQQQAIDALKMALDQKTHYR